MIKIMGRNFVYSIINFLATFTLCCLVSCNEYEPFDEHDLVTMDYETAFVKEFGKPAANHDWGFVDQPIMDFGQATRTVDANSNQWYSNYHTQLNIPGYPDHLHGYFRGTNTLDANGSYTKIIDQEEADKQSDPNWVPNNAGNPKGDITLEEREYVWKWFSTRQNPTSTAIHWDSFFVQYVDSWSDRYPSNKRNMDQLGYEDTHGGWEHINDFNGTTNTMKYVYNAGTENWTYRASHSNSYVYDKYTIQHLIFDIPQIHCPYGCTTHHYDGWYVAFDYESVKFEGDGSLERNSVYGDGYYNDWIVKVSPGNMVGTPETVRVMCEDLGGSFDWDFNDVVFDVSFRRYGSQIYACIAVQAAGGTLPITIGTTDPDYEVHKLLGDGSLTPIIHPWTFAYYEVEYTGEFSDDNTLNAKNIPIYVNGQTATYAISNKSAIAQEFACPDYVQWSEELVNICVTYPNVPEWVSKGRCDNVWTMNPAAQQQTINKVVE